MRMAEISKEYQKGRVEKKLYWTLMREKMKVLTEIQEMLQNSDECESIQISKSDIVQKNASGIKLYYNFSQPICRAEAELYLEKDPEQEDIKFAAASLDENAVVLDVGANVGLYSLSLYNHKKKAQYYAFEPIPDTFRRMEQTMDLNEVPKGKIKCFNIGFSDMGGVQQFFLPPESEAASLRPVEDDFYLKESSVYGDYSGCSKMEEVQCTVAVLDEWCEENDMGKIDFIKIDVEGNEKYVLKGAERILKQDRPMVYCDLLRKHAARFGYHPNEVISFMADLGYCCAVIRDGKISVVEFIDPMTKETNFFFLHKNRHSEILSTNKII